jgi:hypothetical protein
MVEEGEKGREARNANARPLHQAVSERSRRRSSPILPGGPEVRRRKIDPDPMEQKRNEAQAHDGRDHVLR